jgi:WD40 repeat protein
MILGLALGLAGLAGCVSTAASAKPGPSPAARRPERTPAHTQNLGPIGAANAERVTKIWEAAAGGFGRAVAVSHALRRVAYSSGPEVLVFDLKQGQRQPKVKGACSNVVRGGLAYVGDRLIVVCENAAQTVTGSDPTAHELPIAASPVTAAAFAGNHLVIGHHDGVVRLYPVQGGTPTEIPVPGPPIDVKSLALSPDGQRVAVAWIQGSIWWWDVSQPSVPHRLVRHPSESDTVAFSADGRMFAEEGATNTTSIWSFVGKPTLKRKIRNGSWLKRLRFTRDAKWLVRGGSDGLELAEVDGPRRVVLDTRGSVEDVALDEHGATIAAVDRDGRLTVWAPR